MKHTKDKMSYKLKSLSYTCDDESPILLCLINISSCIYVINNTVRQRIYREIRLVGSENISRECIVILPLPLLCFSPESQDPLDIISLTSRDREIDACAGFGMEGD